MAVDVSKRIRNVYHNLSKGHKRVANIVLREPTKVQASSCKRLSIMASVSESTVIRFINAIGFDSFLDFRDAVADEAKNGMKPGEKMIAQTEDTKGADITQRSLTMEIDNIKYTKDRIDEKSVSEFVNVTLKSKRKFIIGFGRDRVLANLLRDNFVTIFDNVTLLSDHDDYFASLLSIGKTDQVIIFAVCDVLKELAGLARYVKSKNVDITLITSRISNELSDLSDRIFTVKSDMLSYADSIVTSVCIINALTLEIIQRDRARIFERNNLLQNINEKYRK